MLIFDGLDFQTRVVKLRPRQVETCAICRHMSERKALELDDVARILEEFDYALFCGVSNYNDKTPSVRLLDETRRITCEHYKRLAEDAKRSATKSHLLIDVRPKCQFEICSLDESLSNY